MPELAQTPNSRGPLFILSGPAATGKSTLIRRLFADSPWPLHFSVSVTTRPSRPRERDGVDYYFWTRERFEEQIRADAFLEWAEVFGNYYGTLKSEVEPYRRQGIGVVLDIDVQGWERVRKLCPDAVSIFIRTSSPGTYEKRLRERGTETEASIQKRLQGAERELARAPEYDHQVINDDLESALRELRTIVAGQFAKERKNDAG